MVQQVSHFSSEVDNNVLNFHVLLHFVVKANLNHLELIPSRSVATASIPPSVTNA